ncbi:MAG: cadherin-like domain-containing protein, partial [Actinomycetota bacterium]
AADDQASTDKGQAVTIDVLANDTDPDGDQLVATNLGPAGNGTATPNADSTITYQPEPDFTGLDSFTYDACDPTPLCDAATVTITVSPEGGGGGGGGHDDDDGDGTQVAGETVEDDTLAFTGPRTAPLLSVMGLLALLGCALIAAAGRLDDPARRPLGFEPLDGGFVIR